MGESEQSEQQQQHQQQHTNGAAQISNGHRTRGPSTSQHHLAETQRVDHQKQRIELFWAEQMEEARQATDFKNHVLPLARVKKIMKADEDVRMISSEAPVVFAKACEMLISELTLRAWMHTEESKRKTLQKNDIAAAISKTDTFDFLVDILPRDELKEETEPIPYYYLPQQNGVGPSGTTVYGGNMPWPQSQQQQNHHHQHHENNDGV